MKSNRNILHLSFLLLGLSLTQQAEAQSNVGGLIKSGPADATKLAESYLNPFFKGLGVGLNSGWNYTANAKNTGRFEIRVIGTPALVPSKGKSFDVNSIGLSSSVRPIDPSRTTAQTVAGKKQAGPEMGVYDNQNNLIDRFTLPRGAKLFAIPSAEIQATVGLPRGIDVTLRGMPQVNMGSDIGKVNMIGGGLKFEILPLLTGKTASKLMPFDLALAIGYTRLNYKLGLKVNAPAGAVPDPTTAQNQDFSNQRIDAKISGLNTEVILSKKLLAFTPFVSVGYNSSKTDAGLKGNYPIITGTLTPLGGPATYSTFTDPVSIKRTDVSDFRGNVGFQLNLAAFRFFAAYSISEYNAVSAGIGLGLGK